MRIGGTLSTKEGLWFFVAWNLLAGVSAVLGFDRFFDEIKSKNLLTYCIAGYGVVGLGFGAWLAGALFRPRAEPRLRGTSP